MVLLTTLDSSVSVVLLEMFRAPADAVQLDTAGLSSTMGLTRALATPATVVPDSPGTPGVSRTRPQSPPTDPCPIQAVPGSNSDAGVGPVGTHPATGTLPH